MGLCEKTLTNSVNACRSLTPHYIVFLPRHPPVPPLYRRQTAGSTVREIIAVSKDSEIVANPTTTDNLRSDAENLKGLYCVIIVRNRKEIAAQSVFENTISTISTTINKIYSYIVFIYQAQGTYVITVCFHDTISSCHTHTTHTNNNMRIGQLQKTPRQTSRQQKS